MNALFPLVLQFARRHLYAHQYPAVVGAVVAVVEQRDVPVGSHVGEKPHQCTRPLGELESVEHLVVGERRLPADEGAEVDFGELEIKTRAHRGAKARD